MEPTMVTASRVRPTYPSSVNRLLGILDPDALAEVSLGMVGVQLKRGAILHDRGKTIDHVFFPIDGLVSLVTVMENGDAVENAIVGHEGAVGTKAGFGRHVSFTRVVAQVPTTALRLRRSEFCHLVDHRAAFRDAISRFNEGLVAQIQQTAACLATHKLEARVCRWLLLAADRMKDDTLPMTQEHLARIHGAHRASLNATLGALQDGEAIRYVARGRLALRRERLEGLACGCYRNIRSVELATSNQNSAAG